MLPEIQKPNYTIKDDTETTGTDPHYDQLVESYSQVQDNQTGKLISEYQSNCKSERFKLPSPTAIFINNCEVKKLINQVHPLEEAENCYEYFEKYEDSEYIAFNSKFDWSFRYSAYFQALRPNPYLLKSKGRIVLCAMEIIRAIESTTDSRHIVVPRIDGVRSFKQQDICYASGIIYSAHQAKADVLAMDKLLKIIEDHHGNYLNRARYFAAKKRSLNFIYAHPFFIGSVGFKGKFSTRCLVPLSCCEKTSKFICIDIGQSSKADMDFLSSQSAYSLEKRISEHPEKNFPLIEIPINKSKLFFEPEYFETSKTGSEIGLSKLKERAHHVWKNSELQDLASRIQSIKRDRYNRKDKTPETSIYENFPTHSERIFMKNFSDVPVQDKFNFLISESKLKHNRYYFLAKRMLLDRYPEFCPEEVVDKFNHWIRDRLHFSNDPYIRTFPKVEREIANLLKKYPNCKDRIYEIEAYFEYRKLKLENI
tara:strand:- start:745 stop:2187 length:1443 start_codon:yes stop_codon:yes gene_type:complete